MLPSKRGLFLPKLVLVPKRQPGVQMDLTSSELPNEIQKIIREDSVKKIAKLIMSQPIKFWKCSMILMMIMNQVSIQVIHDMKFLTAQMLN